MNELKPCPFCGGEAVIKNLLHAAFGEWVVGCSRDNPCELQPDVWRNNRAETIEAWNTRAERTCHYVDDSGLMGACSLCGKPMGEAHHYCPWCGAKAEHTCNAISATNGGWPTWKCSKCEQPIDAAQPYCHGCGAKVVSEND